MSYLKQEFIDYMYNKGNGQPGGYCNGLDNVEKYFKADIDAEYEKDQCQSLYNRIQQTRKNPEQIGKNEHTVRQYASNVKKYIEFRQEYNTSNTIFTWIPFYEEFADKLLPYKVDRLALISLIKKVYSDLGMKLPKLDYEEPLDIDPFTVFGLFNKGITDVNRIKIIKGFKKWLNISADVPTDFSGIPVVNNLSATFYYFVGDREEHDIDNLWELFESALQYSDTKSDEGKVKVIEAYDKVIKQKGVSWNITMGLYWIRPTCFVSLDSRSRNYLVNFNPPVGPTVATNKLPDGDNYFWDIDQLIKSFEHGNPTVKSFYELSYAAFVSEDKRKNKKVKYWLYSPGEQAFNWNRDIETGTMAIGWEFLGDLSQYLTREDVLEAIRKQYNDTESHKNDVAAVWQFVNEISIGDIVIAKRGVSTVIGKGVVTGEYYYDETLDTYKNTISVDWTDIGEWEHPGPAVVKTLTDITPYEDYVKKLLNLFDNENWWPSLEEYNPNITTDEWIEFLTEDSKTYPLTLKMLITMLELGGQATCKKLSEVLGGHPSTYISRATGLGERVKKQFNLPPCMDEDKERFFPIPFVGRKVEETQLYSWKLRPELRKALEIMDLPDFTELDETDSVEVNWTPYTKANFLNDVYIDETKYDTCVSRLKHKKNLILQGAPGVGKTFAARRLAWSMMGVKDDSRIEFVQFHQSYSYEDFIMGYKPVENGFSLENGIFYDFCNKAKNDSENDYFFIIDEINRGNMSKIFGELLMLVENDYRNNSIKLAYSKKPFSIPENLYIIGMMNTADRSLAMIDYALRRRFSFVEMTPGFDSEGFKKYQADINRTAFNNLIGRIKALNSDIENDASLGKGFCIGHSYFCNLDENCENSVLKEIVEYDIVPMLEEYWFDDKAKADRWSDDLRGVLNG